MKILPLILLFIWSCSSDKKVSEKDIVKSHYDSLADALFLSDKIDMKVPVNIDSTEIEFLNDEDFILIIEIRKKCQLISDSLGVRFKIPQYNIKDFGELEMNAQIIEYDTSLFPLIEKYLKHQNTKTLDSLTKRIGISPLTILDFHNKTKRYFDILNQKNEYQEGRRNMIITYYVSELTKVPYPKTLYRLFVNDKNEIIDFGKHEEDDGKIILEEEESVHEATTANKSYKTCAVV